MKTFTLLFLLFFTSQVISQNDGSDSLLLNIHSLKFSLLDAFEPYSHSFLLSYESQIGGKFSLQAEAGPTFGSAQSYFKREKIHGLKIRGELRRYYSVKNRRRYYIGLQYMHKSLSGSDFSGYFRGPDSKSSIEFKTYDYQKNVNAVHLTGGFIHLSGRKAIWDLGIHAGFRKKKTTAVGVPDNYHLQREGDELFYEIEDDVPINTIKLSGGSSVVLDWDLKKASPNLG